MNITVFNRDGKRRVILYSQTDAEKAQLEDVVIALKREEFANRIDFEHGLVPPEANNGEWPAGAKMVALFL